MTTIDLKNLFEQAKNAGYEALPVGDYPVEIVEATAVTSQNGKPMVKVKMRVIGNGPHAKRTVFNQFVLTMDNPNALAMFFRHMKAFGLDETYITSLGQITDLSPIAQALLGRQAQVTLGHRLWQGETRNEVNSIKPIQGGVAQPNGLPGNAAPPAPPGAGAPTPPAALTPPVQPAAPAPAPTPPAPPAQPAPPAAPTQEAAPAPTPPQPPAQPAPTPPAEPTAQASPPAPPGLPF